MPAKRTPMSFHTDGLHMYTQYTHMLCGDVCYNAVSSSRLYCEEVDVGEPEIRKIASGLRAFVKQEDLEGAMVLVLANMKVKALRGYPSHGMLLCASNDAHTEVELMHPPAGAKPGDRITFEGLDHSKGPDDVLSGKKGQEPIPVILPNLRVDGECVGYWKQYRMTLNGEPCKCTTLRDAHIS